MWESNACNAPAPWLQAGLALAPVVTGVELPVDEVGRLIPSAAIEAIDRHAAGCRAFVIGPGFGSDWPQQQIIATLLSRDDRPVILDADGLNALAKLPSGQLELKAPTIMTPHRWRVQAASQLQLRGWQTETAQAVAQAYGCVVVLKSEAMSLQFQMALQLLKKCNGSVVLLQLAEAGTFLLE